MEQTILSVQSIAEDIVRREGGFVNDSDDPGGATNHGVTIHTMRRLGLDVTGDGAVTQADVRALSRTRAVQIFVKHYYTEPRISELPDTLQASVFDMYVNAGSHAVKILQRMIAAMGFEVTADGVIGPQTSRAAQAAYQSAPHHMADAYAIERRNYYFALADKRPASRKYARTRRKSKGGWITRAEAFMAAKYHLTTKAFLKRTASWG